MKNFWGKEGVLRLWVVACPVWLVLFPLLPSPCQTTTWQELPHWWSHLKCVFSEQTVRQFYHRQKLQPGFSWTRLLIFSCVLGLKTAQSPPVRSSFTLRWAAVSASSQKANINERGWGGQAVFAYCQGGRVSELLLGNMFLDDRSSALLSDQSNYFWQIYAVLCELSLACKERNGCINTQNVFDPFIKWGLQ